MTANEVRKRYLDFFQARGHTILPPASLVPENDPSTLFTGSGMQPLIPYLLGKDHPEGQRVADSQKCFRAIDIDEVGDNRHTTFFEMLGNWSLGDYFKQEQLGWFFEFLTKELGVSKERLWVTCFEGNEEFKLPRDTESAAIWKELGIPEDQIAFYGVGKNWWSRSGPPQGMPAGEPGGPDSEVFYEFENVEHDPKFGKKCHPNCDCGRFLEIGNNVFMEYQRTEGSFTMLPRRNVDFGGGLERLTMAAQNNSDIFLANHAEIIKKIEELSGKKYCFIKGDLGYDIEPECWGEDKKAMRIVADHIKASVFLIAAGVKPGNVEQAYVLRRLLRRAVRYGDVLGIKSGGLSELVNIVADQYAETYSNVKDQSSKIAEEIQNEEDKFRVTLTRGLKEFEKGTDPFILFTSYGFPIELTKELAQEKGTTINEAKFDKQMKKHREASKAGLDQKFKGGLADASEVTTRLHTAHHLLLKALQIVLGPEVKQRGSNITAERLRIDFIYRQKMTDEQKQEVEKTVNEKIKEGLPVLHTEMASEEAEKLNAEHEFGAKYPERVSVYSVGPADATAEDPQFDEAFSIEFCGGPHVSNTADLTGPDGDLVFKIKKEEATSAGIRRIKATLTTTS
ncbi:MAG: alanine--tRNA ligase [Patescibacteria group bacterium]|nr:alanine--tRNA ligase [Patescibacteria group bacterium]